MGLRQLSPTEVLIDSPRIHAYDLDDNDMLRRTELDFIEERSEQAVKRMEAYHQRVQRAFNKRVVPRSFQVGDLVLHQVNPSIDVKKLAPKWEGPYKVTRRVVGTSYYIQDVEGTNLLRPWNAIHLQCFYC